MSDAMRAIAEDAHRSNAVWRWMNTLHRLHLSSPSLWDVAQALGVRIDGVLGVSSDRQTAYAEKARAEQEMDEAVRNVSQLAVIHQGGEYRVVRFEAKTACLKRVVDHLDGRTLGSGDYRVLLYRYVPTVPPYLEDACKPLYGRGYNRAYDAFVAGCEPPPSVESVAVKVQKKRAWFLHMKSAMFATKRARLRRDLRAERCSVDQMQRYLRAQQKCDDANEALYVDGTMATDDDIVRRDYTGIAASTRSAIFALVDAHYTQKVLEVYEVLEKEDHDASKHIEDCIRIETFLLGSGHASCTNEAWHMTRRLVPRALSDRIGDGAAVLAHVSRELMAQAVMA